MPRLIVSFATLISRITTYNWLLRLSFYKLKMKKGVYVDGYKREDVIAYRQGVFLLIIAKLDLYTVGGQTSARRNPTGTIPGN